MTNKLLVGIIILLQLVICLFFLSLVVRYVKKAPNQKSNIVKNC